MSYDPDEAEETTEYTRLKLKLQRGDGPDQRGEATVEVLRADGDAAFEEFNTQVTRAKAELLTALDLPKGGA